VRAASSAWLGLGAGGDDAADGLQRLMQPSAGRAAAVAAGRLAAVKGSPYEDEIVQDVPDTIVQAPELAPPIQGMVLAATDLSDVRIRIDTCACDNCSGLSGPKSGASHLQLSGISEETVDALLAG
jgi:hypothetical protein